MTQKMSERQYVPIYYTFANGEASFFLNAYTCFIIHFFYVQFCMKIKQFKYDVQMSHG